MRGRGRRVRRWGAPLVAMLVAGAIVACYGSTQIEMGVTTDVGCDRVRASGIEIRVAGRTEQLPNAPPVATSTMCTAAAVNQLGSLTLIPSGAGDNFTVEVILGVDRPTRDCRPPAQIAGCIVARRAIGFVKHESLALPIRLDQSCLGVSCRQDETCERGECVSAVSQCPAGTCVLEATSDDGGGVTGLTDGSLPIADAALPPADAATEAEAGDASGPRRCVSDCKNYPTADQCASKCSIPATCSPNLTAACP